MGTHPSREETVTGVQNPSVSAMQVRSEHAEPTRPPEVARGNASTSRDGNGASYTQQSTSRPATQPERALVTIQESHESSRLSTQTGRPQSSTVQEIPQPIPILAESFGVDDDGL